MSTTMSLFPLSSNPPFSSIQELMGMKTLLMSDLILHFVYKVQYVWEKNQASLCVGCDGHLQHGVLEVVGSLSNKSYKVVCICHALRECYSKPYLQIEPTKHWQLYKFVTQSEDHIQNQNTSKPTECVQYFI